MNKTRLEAFSDGVIAILITIMVLDLRSPAGPDLAGLLVVLPTLATYLLSFVFLGIYWNNHHHFLHATSRINGVVLWANLHVLFWLSLIPFATRWMSESDFAAVPVAGYGVVMLLSGVAYWILVHAILACQPSDSMLVQAIGRDIKGNLSVLTYVIAIPLTLLDPRVSLGLYSLVALMWFLPDRRIESRLSVAAGADPAAE